MTDWTPEEDEAFNNVEKNSNLGKQILRDIEGQPYVYAPKREWVGLTDEEIWETISRIGTSDSDVNPYAKLADARAIEAKLKEKNT
jgi:hypothetical protein